MVAGDRPPSSTSKEEEEKKEEEETSQFFAVRGAEADPHGRPGTTPFLTATVTSTFVCSVPASVSWHEVEEYVLLSASLLGSGDDAFRAVFPR